MRYSQGGVTIELSGELEDFVKRSLSAVEATAIELMERQAQSVAREAEQQWYQQVNKDTGQSGNITTVTTVTDKSVRVDVGSLDRRMVGGKPLIVYIHRPAPISIVYESVSPAEFWKTPVSMRGKYPTIKRPNPKAADGKFLLELLIKKPIRQIKKKLGRELGRQIALAMGITGRKKRNRRK